MSQSGSGAQFRDVQMTMFPEPERLPRWRMSPDQFANDPDTYFHSSFYKDPKTKTSQFRGLHLGSEQAALERVANKGNHDGWARDAELADPEVDPQAPSRVRAAIHRYNLRDVGVARLDSPVEDEEANDLDRAPYIRPTAYSNFAEDVDAPSVVVDNPSHMRSHAEIVSAALAKGADKSKMHPHTRLLYDAGILDTHHLVDPDVVHEEVRPMSQIHEQHSGGLFPYRLGHGSGNRGQTVRHASREEIASHLPAEHRDNALSTMYDEHSYDVYDRGDQERRHSDFVQADKGRTAFNESEQSRLRTERRLPGLQVHTTKDVPTTAPQRVSDRGRRVPPS